MPVDGGCSEAACVIVRAAASGLVPGETAAARCYVEAEGQLTQVGDAVDVTATADGSAWIADLCTIPGTQPAVVMIGTTTSPAF